MPLFVLRMADDGAAKLDGRLSVGDQIIEINGVTTHLMTHAQVRETSLGVVSLPVSLFHEYMIFTLRFVLNALS